MLTSVSAQQGGSWAPVRAVKPRRADAQTTLKVDVDRLGTIALNAMTQLLELLPLRRLDADKKNAIPEVLLFKCSHNVSTAAPVTPTFPSRDANDKRLRSAERLLAGEQLVRALVRHVAVNHRLRTLEVTHAPLRLFDWQGLFAGIRSSGCALTALSLAGSRIGDAGLAALGPALLKQPTLRTLSLDGCGLTSEASVWLIRILQDSNVRQNKGRAKAEMRTWAKGLRSHGSSLSAASSRRAGKAPPPPPLDADADDDGDDDDAPAVGLVSLSLAGNDLGEQGGLALANHLMLDRWLEELDLRRNGIGDAGLRCLRDAAAERETAETEKLLTVPPLTLRLDGNAQERRAAAATAAASARSRQAAIPHGHAHHASARGRAPHTAYHAVRGYAVKARRPRSAPEQERMVLQKEARRLRQQLALKRAAAGRAAAAMELSAQIERGARAAALAPTGREPPLSAADWKGLVEASGGADVLLDALEGLVAVAVQRAAASRSKAKQ